MHSFRSVTFLGNRYSSCNLQTRENRLLGIAPNDSPSKTALGNGLADKIRRWKSRSRVISVTVARLHRDRDYIEIEISKKSEKNLSDAVFDEESHGAIRRSPFGRQWVVIQHLPPPLWDPDGTYPLLGSGLD